MEGIDMSDKQAVMTKDGSKVNTRRHCEKTINKENRGVKPQILFHPQNLPATRDLQ
jgi:hypothetical protein